MQPDFSLFLKKWPDFQVLGPLKSGKEADVYKIKISDEVLVLKIYRSDFFKKNRQKYMDGQFISSPSLRRSILKKNKTSKNFLEHAWISQEFYLLKKLKKQAVLVPTVVEQIENSLIMEFLGDEAGPAPRLIDANFNKEEAEKCLSQILTFVQKMWQLDIVHADLSAYNILWWKNQPFLIDFPQAVRVTTNPQALEFWHRDLQNLEDFFQKWNLSIPNEFKSIVNTKPF